MAGCYVRRQIQGIAFMMWKKAPLSSGALVLIVNGQRKLLRDNVDSAGTFLAMLHVEGYGLSIFQ